MAHVLSAVLLAISSNVDNLAVGIAYGVQRRWIRLRHNLTIAIVSASGTLASMAAGEWVNDYMTEELANALGSAILILIGGHCVAQALRTPSCEAPRIAAGTATRTREAGALATALTLNNLGAGLGAGVSHVDIAFTTVLTFGLSIAAIVSGYLLGSRTAIAISGRELGLIAGLLLVILGLYEYFV
jgi:putative Mn2+ efflux pump MntP